MRRLLISLLIGLLLIPSGAVLAQDDSGFDGMGDMGIPRRCQPMPVLESMMGMVEQTDDLADVDALVDFVMLTAESCAEAWWQATYAWVIQPIMMALSPLEEPIGLNPDDSVLTSDEAEYAINQLLAGNMDRVNQYLCPDEQITEADLLPAPAYANEITCIADDAETMRCYIDALVGGTPYNETVIFEVEDGKLCGNSTE